MTSSVPERIIAIFVRNPIFKTLAYEEDVDRLVRLEDPMLAERIGRQLSSTRVPSRPRLVKASPSAANTRQQGLFVVDISNQNLVTIHIGMASIITSVVFRFVMPSALTLQFGSRFEALLFAGPKIV